MLLKACLNGPRRPGDHPALPVTPTELAAAAAAAVAAGAGALHVHPKDGSGADTLDAAAVAAAVTAVRAAAPGTPVGVTTGAWAAADPAARRAAVRGWTVLPDFASVNWHEPGSTELAADLLDRGVGVEAGLWTPDAVRAWLAWPERDRCLRVLLEVCRPAPDGAPARRAVRRRSPPPAAWSRRSARTRACRSCCTARASPPGRSSSTPAAAAWTPASASRTPSCCPDGSPAPDNAALVTAARTLLATTRTR